MACMPIDFWVKRSRLQCIGYLKLYLAHNCFPLTSIIMKLHAQTPTELWMCPIDLGSKGQGHNALITKNVLCCKIFHVYSSSCL